MILGIGADLVDSRRISRLVGRFAERFTARCFTLAEREAAGSLGKSDAIAAFYARRFAAKEACAKALGTGFRGGVSFRDIEIGSLPNRKPSLTLSGKALARLEALTPDGCAPRLHLSLTDEPPYAQAFVIVEAVP